MTEFNFDESITLPRDYVQLFAGAPTGGDVGTPRGTRGLACGTSGTIDGTIIAEDGPRERVGVPIAAGQVLGGRWIKVKDTSTAENIWAVL